jgi:hypothetical protein
MFVCSWMEVGAQQRAAHRADHTSGRAEVGAGGCVLSFLL